MRSWLKELRRSLSYTQDQVADKSGISRAYYTQIELNNRTPSPKVAMEIGKVLEFDWTRFYEE
ncbi:MAG: helix-turn-helix transcriptional regulator [Clostridiaceae bacterium]|jgi:putative transcriptional regulator|nr:helix-turn-helix transcriptional regulator [Bacillota bacterium]NLN51825.1 helix-turn-helix transcriptional regulator [Clostridiaceae bacterium]